MIFDGVLRFMRGGLTSHWTLHLALHGGWSAQPEQFGVSHEKP